MRAKRNPLTDPRDGDVFSRHGLHYEVSDVTPDGLRWREWHGGDDWLWMSRCSFAQWVREPGVICRTRLEWIAEQR